MICNANVFCMYISRLSKKFDDKLLHLEIDPLKTNSKISKLKIECDAILTDLDTLANNKLYSCNYYLSFVTFCFIHTVLIYKKKKVLSEMGKDCYKHFTYCLYPSVIIGYLIGNYVGNNLRCAYILRKTKKDINMKMLDIKKRYEYI
jgi:hypothetical protein